MLEKLSLFGFDRFFNELFQNFKIGNRGYHLNPDPEHLLKSGICRNRNTVFKEIFPERKILKDGTLFSGILKILKYGMCPERKILKHGTYFMRNY
jgi:hypothetical protein